MKILLFIGTLSSGGKERRLVELLTYLKKKPGYDLMVVLRRNIIDYPSFYNLDIPYKTLTDQYKKGDKTLHYKFYKICKEYKPDIIHTWGSVPAFVSILSVILLRITHINSQITNAPPKLKWWSILNIISKINFAFSDLIIANSKTGLNCYNVSSEKGKVIYNGVNLERFENLNEINNIKSKFGISTPYSVIMIATFYKMKDYDKYIDIAKKVMFKRNDISFIAVGDGVNLNRIKERVQSERISNVLFTGKISDVENLINVTDIGILLSNKLLHGEGIANSIIEYFALGKPVIANDAGGTKEIVKNGINGYLITDESIEEIADLIDDLISNVEKRLKWGKAGRKLIHDSFTIDRMGREFEDVYLRYSQKGFLECSQINK